MIHTVRNLVQSIFERTHGNVRLSQLVAYPVGLLLLLYAGNAHPSSLSAHYKENSGPISVVNQAPIQLLFLQAMPDKAETLPKGQGSLHLKTAVTNTLLSERSTNYQGVVDLEMIRASLDLQYGILTGLEIGMSLPLVYSYSGVMDHAILEFEEFVGAESRPVRKKQEPDKYEYYVKRDSKAFIAGTGKRSSGIGDLVVRLKGKVWDGGDILPYLSARLEVKVPSGDKDRALGSGKADYGFGLLLQKDFNRLIAYLNADVIFPGDAFEQVNLQLNEFYEIMLGAEYKLSSRFSVLAQVNCITRPFKDTGLQMLDRRIYDALVGVDYCTKHGVFVQGGLIEDFKNSGNAGADITFFLTIGKSF